MLTPVAATLPESTLSPSQILQKFSSQSLAGLGRGPFPFGFAGLGDCGTCDDFDDDGNCLEYDTSGCTSTGGTITPPPTTVVSSGATSTPTTTISNGSTSSSLCDPSSSSYNPTLCSQLQGPAASSSSSGVSSSALTSAQIAQLAALGITNAAKVATISQLPAGYSIGANGAIIAPQTSLLSGSSGMLLLLLAAGALVLVMAEGGKK
jgi:hypothetical protein